ncbi:hypothetical protein ENSA5_48620 [Enhygromyxa salina]|uniref:Uncharacterized protein n=1 Tax=Enhygromyxa salina TaxID=215803 RepID=A0A2S9XHT6_9BACT|nr:hypothetical protein [Enhygromyxa salina]PRP92444.1 hypothetical protein ENSA5_48620 [Enhygromyxa salina]
MYGALPLALALTLGPAKTPAETPAGRGAEHQTPLSTEQCREQQLDFFVGFGPAEAPTLLKVYLDPTETETSPLRVWLELRRIAGERGDELRVELIPTRGGLANPDPEPDSVRLWFMAVAALGELEEALRLLDRQDWLRIAAELRSEDGRDRLARAVGLDADAIEALRTGAAGGCLRRSLDRASAGLAVQTMGQRSSLIGVVDRAGTEQFQYVDAELSELRTQIDRLVTAPSYADVAIGFVPFGPSMISRTSRLDRTFPETGVLVGGEALPHRLVIFVEDEEHGRLPDWLGPAMRYRTQHPGRMSVQLIAAGVGSRAIGLRRRLCAARTLGLEVEYLLLLSEHPAARRLHETDLHEVLQPVADSDACSDSEPLESPGVGEEPSSRRGGDFGHPRGAWFDGRPVNPADLESLEWQLDSDLQPSIIDWLTTPDSQAMDVVSPGF